MKRFGIEFIRKPSFIGTNTILTATGYAVVFDAAGTYTYECGIHGPSMHGTVVVR